MKRTVYIAFSSHIEAKLFRPTKKIPDEAAFAAQFGATVSSKKAYDEYVYARTGAKARRDAAKKTA